MANNHEAAIEAVRGAVPDQTSFSLYQVAKIWGELRGKEVRPQMMYNYKANHMIKVMSDGKVAYQDLVEFLTKKLTK